MPPHDTTHESEALAAKGVSVLFGGVRALHAVDFLVAPAEIVGLNGAGKTTLFDALSGIRPPAKGSIVLDGTDTGRKRCPRG